MIIAYLLLLLAYSIAFFTLGRLYQIEIEREAEERLQEDKKLNEYWEKIFGVR